MTLLIQPHVHLNAADDTNPMSLSSVAVDMVSITTPPHCHHASSSTPVYVIVGPLVVQ